MSSITITSPTTDSTVNRPFTATGTYVSSVLLPAVSVVLKDSTGTVVATGVPTIVAGGNWSSKLSPTQGYTDASVEASIAGEGVSDSVGNITVT
jgi:hypothetical protein